MMVSERCTVILHNFFSDRTSKYWIGLKDESGSGLWAWDKCGTIRYDHWADTYPVTGTSEKYGYGDISNQHKWQNSNSYSINIVLCEKEPICNCKYLTFISL